MSRTTDQWQKLLDTVGDTDVEAVTERAFFSEAEGDVEFHNIQYTGGRVVDGWLNPGQSFRSREWAELVAAAPEAVGEVVRLRRELETMRGWAESLGTGRPGGPQVAQKITNIIDQEEK